MMTPFADTLMFVPDVYCKRFKNRFADDVVTVHAFVPVEVGRMVMVKVGPVTPLMVVVALPDGAANW